MPLCGERKRSRKPETTPMAINPPLPRDTRSRLTDWLEIEVLVRSRQVATRADILRLYDFIEEEGHNIEIDDVTGEKLETEILSEDRTRCADDVLSEIEYRSSVLGDDYPFTTEISRQQWRILPAATNPDNRIEAARTCYLFCLLISAIRDERISGDMIAELRRSMANHFQAVATDAAAGVLNGEAISFGFPRPTGSGFRPALEAASQKMRLGKTLDSVPLWSQGHEKDAGIDVIAWRDFRDGRPSKLVMLGQVASGYNWLEKSVKNETYRFFDWFSERPTEHFIPSIFIPFPQHHDCEARDDATFEETAIANAWHRERGFGLIIDRLRIVEAAAARLVTACSRQKKSTLELMREWMIETLRVAREAV